jgi:hypothetical protein
MDLRKAKTIGASIEFVATTMLLPSSNRLGKVHLGSGPSKEGDGKLKSAFVWKRICVVGLHFSFCKEGYVHGI